MKKNLYTSLLLPLLFTLVCATIGSASATAQTVGREPIAAIRIYPNPVAEYMQLSPLDGVEEVQLYNIIGKRVKEWRLEDDSDNKLFVADIPRGMYLVRVVGRNGNIICTLRLNKINP